MVEQDEPEAAPSLLAQTLALGKTFKLRADEEPDARPTDLAATVFAEWVATAGAVSLEPLFFADVAGNYDVQFNTNKDLWELFELLRNYMEIENEDDLDPEPTRSFIKLPMLGNG